MQTTFDGPFGLGAGVADEKPYDDTLVAMRTEDGGLEILGEKVVFILSPDDVRTLLFYGSTVELEGSDGTTAGIGVDPRRYTLMLVLEGRAYRAPRWAIMAVARGRLPAAYLRTGGRRHRREPAESSTYGRTTHLADTRG